MLMNIGTSPSNTRLTKFQQNNFAFHVGLKSHFFCVRMIEFNFSKTIKEA